MKGLFGEEPFGATSQYTSYVEVAPDTVIASADVTRTYSYGVPEGMVLQAGQRVIVKLRNRKVGGMVIRVVSLPPSGVKPSRIQPVVAIDDGLCLPSKLLELANWMAVYYCCSLGQVLGNMMPAAVKKQTGHIVRREVRITPDETVIPRLRPSQHKIVAYMCSYGDWLSEKELCDALDIKTVTPIRNLIGKGVLELREIEDIRVHGEVMPDRLAGGTAPSKWTDDQLRAISHLDGHLQQGFSVHLLHGVTGSGKTEVFLRAIELWLEKENRPDAGALILVPEIALTPQTLGRFYNRFQHLGIAVLHSGLTSSQRHYQWKRIVSGEARLVIGARSSVFAPLPHLGLIVVDEEHDGSYKQDQSPRYNARDVAVRRAQLQDCPIVLASATPSLESYVNAAGNGMSHTARKHWHYVPMTTRPGVAELPHVQIVDMAEERRDAKGMFLLSRILTEKIKETIAQKQQVMLLLNRRGYAGWLACASDHCGWQLQCDHCSVNLVQHKHGAVAQRGFVRCHHCGAEQRMPQQCPVCRLKLRVLSPGTQKVEEVLAKLFPDARVLRMDADTMKRGADYHQTLQTFRQGEADILIGTQMIAKGLDFSAVTLVGVISADTVLNIPDFRASERAFQLVTQVAGRAGRGQIKGQVIVQTFQPDAPALQAAVKHDYKSFAQDEWQARQALNKPPAMRMARVVIRHVNTDKALQLAKDCADDMRANNMAGVFIEGPSPCMIERLQDEWRFEITLTSAKSSDIVACLNAQSQRLLRSDFSVDIDPLHMM